MPDKRVARAIAAADLKEYDNVVIDGDDALSQELRQQALAVKGVRILNASDLDPAADEDVRPNVVFITKGEAGFLESMVKRITPAGRIIVLHAEDRNGSFNVLATSHKELLICGIGEE